MTMLQLQPHKKPFWWPFSTFKCDQWQSSRHIL